MNLTLTELVNKLKDAEAIRSRPELITLLNSIDNFRHDDALRAYLLGAFFRHKIDITHLLPEERQAVDGTITRLNLKSWFDHKRKPAGDFPVFLNYIFIIGGLLAIAGGSIQLANSRFTYGLNMYYLHPVIQEGGWFIIWGLGFLVAGLSRQRYDHRRKMLLKELCA